MANSTLLNKFFALEDEYNMYRKALAVESNPTVRNLLDVICYALEDEGWLVRDELEARGFSL